MNVDAVVHKPQGHLKQSIYYLFRSIHGYYGSAFSLIYPCIACIKKCFPPWQDPFLARYKTLAILAKILCFPDLAIDVSHKVIPKEFHL